MSLLDVLRVGVKLIDSTTKPLQSVVRFERHVSVSGAGVETYASAVQLKAIVDWKQKLVRTMSGEMVPCVATVIFVDVSALAKATANNGVSPEDRITLPDGRTGPILNVAGFMDPGTARPVASEVYIG
jgi:hypothetical protein